jgi:hypothetical protein
LDRGFDNKKLIDYFIGKDEKFIIRAKKKNEKVKTVKISYIPIELPAFPGKELTLVAVFGLGKTPMMLITNITSDRKIIAKTILKVYLLRWRIEDYFKFKKQQFDFENIRVRKIKSIRNMNQILTLVIGFIGILSEKQDKTVFMQKIFEKANAIYDEEKITFTYYRISDGIKNTLAKTTTGIEHLLPKSEYVKSQQLSLFKRSYIEQYMPLVS